MQAWGAARRRSGRFTTHRRSDAEQEANLHAVFARTIYTEVQAVSGRKGKGGFLAGTDQFRGDKNLPLKTLND